jgi:hypothetical protein
MDEAQRKIIRAGFWAGLSEHEIADHSGVDLAEVDVYLGWWCNCGCPLGGHGLMPTCSSEGQED